MLFRSVRALDAYGIVMLEPTATEAWGLRVMHYSVADGDFPAWFYPKDQDHTDVRGEDAIRIAGQLLPVLNAKGASTKQIKDAVVLATEYPDPSTTFERAVRLAVTKPSWKEYGHGAILSRISPELLLALEMVSHEDSERRELEGELCLLEEAWKEAAEIAGISDDMFLPQDITTKLDQMKAR